LHQSITDHVEAPSCFAAWPVVSGLLSSPTWPTSILLILEFLRTVWHCPLLDASFGHGVWRSL